MLRGDVPLPWEASPASSTLRTLGTLRRPVLGLLCRDAERRSQLREFHAACTAAFGRGATVEA